jgi:hypothetical protein
MKSIPKSTISKWYNVDVEVYKIAFDLAKERFNDILAESESITDKTIKIISGLLVFTGFFASILFNKEDLIKDHRDLLVWSSTPIIVNLIMLCLLLFPKKIRNRGLPPLVSFVKGFDDEENHGFQQQLMYFNCLSIFQANTDFMIIQNESRAKIYKFSLMLSIAVLVYIPFFTVYIILIRS